MESQAMLMYWKTNIAKNPCYPKLSVIPLNPNQHSSGTSHRRESLKFEWNQKTPSGAEVILTKRAMLETSCSVISSSFTNLHKSRQHGTGVKSDT